MRIFADTACDIPREYYDNGHVVPFELTVEVNGNVYKDVFEMDGKKLYDALRDGAQPKTSQVAPDIFMTKFEDLAKSGEEGIYIAFSSELSGTYSTANMIKAQLLETYPDMKLEIIDSKSASYGLGMSILEAVRLKEAGKSYEEVVSEMKKFVTCVNHIFTVGDLNHLAKNGRVSKTSAVVGGMLNIKPILIVQDGKLTPIDKVRGQKKAINYMADYLEKKGGDFTNKNIGICHSDDIELVEAVKVVLTERLHPASFEVVTIGSVIGAHVGLGTVGIFFTDAE